MIAEHQPKHMPGDRIVVATSCVGDGPMRNPRQAPETIPTLENWLCAQDIDPYMSVGMGITYAPGRTYDKIVRVDAPASDAGTSESAGWIYADALVTATPGVGLVLPVADCGAVTMYDPAHHVVALAHLGWHSTVNDLAEKTISYMKYHHRTNPRDVLVYHPPSIRTPSYTFDFLDEMGNPRWREAPYTTRDDMGKYVIDVLRYNLDAFDRAGVRSDNIDVVDVNTFESPDYYSYTARKVPGQEWRSVGRFACAAMLR